MCQCAMALSGTVHKRSDASGSGWQRNIRRSGETTLETRKGRQQAVSVIVVEAWGGVLRGVLLSRHPLRWHDVRLAVCLLAGCSGAFESGWGSHRGANAMVDGEYDHRIRKLHDGNRPFADANGRQQSQWHSYGGIRTPMVSECPLVRHCTTTSCAHCTHQPCGLVRLCTILTPSCVSLNCDTKSALPSTRTAARSHLSPKAKKQKLFVYACIGDCMCFVMYYVPKYTECLSTGDGFRTLGILVPSRQSVASDCLGYHRIRMPIARSDHRIRIGIAL